MTLQQIETFVLMNIGGSRYTEMSISSDPNVIEDFSLLHNCVDFARDEVKINTYCPQMEKFGTAIVASAGTSGYPLPSDFDVPIAIYYAAQVSTVGARLTKVYAENLPETVNIDEQGTPDSYILNDVDSDLASITILPVPDKVGYILPLYKPTITPLTLSTAEDILMRKYSLTVVKFATAFFFQLIKKDMANFASWYGMGMQDCQKITQRELDSDSSYREKPDDLMRRRRMARNTK
jgi:hypothetical protein